MELAKIIVEPIGPGIHTHNMPCAVCRQNHAVFVSPGFRFEPCWGCQRDGWNLTQRKRRKWFIGLFGDGLPPWAP